MNGQYVVGCDYGVLYHTAEMAMSVCLFVCLFTERLKICNGSCVERVQIK